MSKYRVFKKKHFCKYCDIYIADDAPSRQHHENGLRHKGNLEWCIRGIYKACEKKKDLEEEKREMARMEQAANGNVVPGPDSDLLGKRPAEEAPSDDTRTFKLRKKTTTVGLGKIYRPGIIPIKLKKKEDTSAIASLESSSTSTDAQRPKWTAISLKPQDSTTATTNSGESPTAPSGTDESTEKLGNKATKGWAKE